MQAVEYLRATESGNVEIPARICHKLGILPGATVQVITGDSEIVMKISRREIVEQARGIFGLKKSLLKELLSERAADREREKHG